VCGFTHGFMACRGKVQAIRQEFRPVAFLLADQGWLPLIDLHMPKSIESNGKLQNDIQSSPT